MAGKDENGKAADNDPDNKIEPDEAIEKQEDNTGPSAEDQTAPEVETEESLSAEVEETIPDAELVEESDSPETEDSAEQDAFEDGDVSETVSEVDDAEAETNDDAETDDDTQTNEDTEYSPEEPEPEPEPTTPAPAPVETKSRGFVGGLFGGVIAAIIGFLAAQIFPDNWPLDFSNSELRTEIAEQSGAIDALTASLGELDTKVTGQGEAIEAGASQTETSLAALQSMNETLQSRLDATLAETLGKLDAEVAERDEQLAAIATKIQELERRPIADSNNPAIASALAAYGREVEELRNTLSADVAAAREDLTQTVADAQAALDERMASAEAMVEEEIARNQEMVEDRAAAEAAAAAEVAAAAEAQAMLEVQAALEVGEPFAEPLSRISSVEIPDVLSTSADGGVPTLEALKESLPGLARQALDVSRKEVVGDGAGDRLTTFFQTQLGVRSLEPRDGDDPDAVLSRAEAALVSGELDVAVETLEQLPPSGLAIVAELKDQIQQRHDVVTAADALSATLNSN